MTRVKQTRGERACRDRNVATQQTIRFRLSLAAEDFLRYYQGQIRQIQVTSEDGRTVRFPASALRPYLTHSGIHGRFEIHFDEHNRLAGLTVIE